ncbi:hypothetical protein GETHLI_19250 [Geothrix limicola]|uniref:Uncharacterized protein n=1 Tax=Geothrix limicola TaxID=2927978 RepID=A0ABQ5QGE5_9BACT|nr:hypothetical protein [Geothrix limicola]GLH73423.1 hypothetical protein GETHLI_19250 [Geothrix limicola]
MKPRPSILRSVNPAIAASQTGVLIHRPMNPATPGPFKGMLQLGTQQALDYMVAILRKSW